MYKTKICDLYIAILKRGCKYRVHNGQAEWIKIDSDHYHKSEFDGLINDWIVNDLSNTT